ncbi:disulfide oxidoreductase [Shouchella sp. 1P09AA]|uniref:disulfide oxidoreductase n=1 Tax=unclassified Shouchella TaxID=2893065 RepID=UPI0039A323CD
MIKETKNQFLLYFAWLVSLIATMGSLYFSEIREFIPCEMCWYQRILMYPLVIILGLSILYKDVKIRRYVLPISLLGIATSSYHYALQKFPSLFPVSPCQEGVPCNIAYINWFGFVTIPFLALTGFTLITIFLLTIQEKKRGTK